MNVVLLNPNSKVSVKLNADGEDLIRQLREAMVAENPNLYGRMLFPVTDPDTGWSDWTLWDLMSTLGPYMRIGGSTLFDEMKVVG